MRVILFADNDGDFLDTRAEFLERAGYKVIKARTPEEARQLLSEARIHMAILDVRLEDDDDDRDISGLTLAKDSAFRVIPKIILTGRAFEFERVREALRELPDGYRPAINYLAKSEGPEALILEVEKIFTQHVCINWDLNIRWGRQNDLSSLYMVSILAPRLPPERSAEWGAELEDVLRKLFYEYQQLTVGRILTRRPGWVLLTAFAYPAHSPKEEQFILACGQRDSIRADRAGHKSLPQATPGSLILVESVETMHWGATVYRLVGCNEIEEVTTLTRFYHQQPTEQVVASVTDLFRTTLYPWYMRGREKRDQPIEALCQERLEAEGRLLIPSELNRRIDSLSQAALAAGLLKELSCSSHNIRFCPPGGEEFSYLNPVPSLLRGYLVTRPPTQCGNIHGRLDGASILVDRSGRTWVVDFGKAGSGPLVQDFVSLETSVRFDMLDEPGIVWRHELERRLLDQHRLEDPVDTKGVPPEVEKALQVICEIRARAAEMVRPEMEMYLVGLFFCALERFMDYQPELRYTKGERATYLHALLLLGMLCQRLAAPEDRLQQLPAQAVQSLWLDEANQEVWVEGRCVALTPQEFRLLKYLYDHANQLCQREALAEHVFSIPLSGLHREQAKQVIRDTINSAVRRLREEIEPNPDRPTYIQTVRGRGYKLVLPSVLPGRNA